MSRQAEDQCQEKLDTAIECLVGCLLSREGSIRESIRRCPGQLTIFLTRTRGPFWSIRPANVLLVATTGAQTVATLVSVYGVLMTPIGWGWALAVWGYALAWFLVNDRVKLLGYRIVDPTEPSLLTKRLQ